MKRSIAISGALVAVAVFASSANAAPTFPTFPSLPSIIAGIVGYQIPVVCEPSLSQGAAIDGVALTIAYQGGQSTYTPQYPPFANTEDGVTLFFGVVAGAVVSVSYGGQTATLPQVPTTTPNTQEAGVPSPYVAVPVAIALDQSVCNVWSASRDSTICGVYCGVQNHGVALLVAIHEAMHARYAEGNEALTECRAMQAFQNVLSTLFPTLTDPGNEPVRPTKPVALHDSAAWKATHPAVWKKLQARSRAAYTHWQAAFARWKQADAPWKSAKALWDNEQSAKTAMASGANTDDLGLPPAYHGASC